MQIDDKAVEAVAVVLLGSVNAPEQAIYQAARAALEAAFATLPAPVAVAEAVGEAGEMPGSNGGFTMAVFKASDVPLGTKLYAAPPAAEAVRIAELEAGLRDLLEMTEDPEHDADPEESVFAHARALLKGRRAACPASAHSAQPPTRQAGRGRLQAPI